MKMWQNLHFVEQKLACGAYEITVSNFDSQGKFSKNLEKSGG
jgi:hypothetical protein